MPGYAGGQRQQKPGSAKVVNGQPTPNTSVGPEKSDQIEQPEQLEAELVIQKSSIIRKPSEQLSRRDLQVKSTVDMVRFENDEKDVEEMASDQISRVDIRQKSTVDFIIFDNDNRSADNHKKARKQGPTEKSSIINIRQKSTMELIRLENDNENSDDQLKSRMDKASEQDSGIDLQQTSAVDVARFDYNNKRDDNHQKADTDNASEQASRIDLRQKSTMDVVKLEKRSGMDESAEDIRRDIQQKSKLSVIRLENDNVNEDNQQVGILGSKELDSRQENIINFRQKSTLDMINRDKSRRQDNNQQKRGKGKAVQKNKEDNINGSEAKAKQTLLNQIDQDFHEIMKELDKRAGILQDPESEPVIFLKKTKESDQNNKLVKISSSTRNIIGSTYIKVKQLNNDTERKSSDNKIKFEDISQLAVDIKPESDGSLDANSMNLYGRLHDRIGIGKKTSQILGDTEDLLKYVQESLNMQEQEIGLIINDSKRSHSKYLDEDEQDRSTVDEQQPETSENCGRNVNEVLFLRDDGVSEKSSIGSGVRYYKMLAQVLSEKLKVLQNNQAVESDVSAMSVQLASSYSLSPPVTEMIEHARNIKMPTNQMVAKPTVLPSNRVIDPPNLIQPISNQHLNLTNTDDQSMVIQIILPDEVADPENVIFQVNSPPTDVVEDLHPTTAIIPELQIPSNSNEINESRNSPPKSGGKVQLASNTNQLKPEIKDGNTGTLANLQPKAKPKKLKQFFGKLKKGFPGLGHCLRGDKDFSKSNQSATTSAERHHRLAHSKSLQSMASNKSYECSSHESLPK